MARTSVPSRFSGTVSVSSTSMPNSCSRYSINSRIPVESMTPDPISESAADGIRVSSPSSRLSRMNCSTRSCTSPTFSSFRSNPPGTPRRANELGCARYRRNRSLPARMRWRPEPRALFSHADVPPRCVPHHRQLEYPPVPPGLHRVAARADRTGQLQIVVVDNGSHDGSQEALREAYPGVTLIENGANLGFARANNIGFEVSTGRYLCLVNTDVIALDGVVDKMVAYMDSHPGVGVLGPRTVTRDLALRQNCRRFPTLANAAGDYLMLKRILPGVERFEGRHAEGVHLLDHPRGRGAVGVLHDGPPGGLRRGRSPRRGFLLLRRGHRLVQAVPRCRLEGGLLRRRSGDPLRGGQHQGVSREVLPHHGAGRPEGTGASTTPGQPVAPMWR